MACDGTPEPHPGRPWGVYGLALDGTALPTDADADPDWPRVRVEFVATGRPEQPARNGLHIHQGSFPVLGGGRVLLRRDPLAMTFRLPAPPVPGEVPPNLSTAVAGVSHWLGREAFHAGALVAGTGTWMVAGRSGAGKSTLMAALAVAGADVCSDDLVVNGPGGIFAGPRSVDLRLGTAERLGVPSESARSGARRRFRLPPAPPRRPLVGWIDLTWGPDISLHLLDTPARLQRLSRRRAFPAKMPTGATLLELAGLPGYVLTRPRRFDAMDDVVAAVTELTGQRLPPICVRPATEPSSRSAGGSYRRRASGAPAGDGPSDSGGFDCGAASLVDMRRRLEAPSGEVSATSDDDAARVRLRSDTVRWRAVDDQVLVIDLRARRYLAVAGAGAVLWPALAEGTTPAALAALLVEEFAVDAATAHRDVAGLLAELRAGGLVDAGA